MTPPAVRARNDTERGAPALAAADWDRVAGELNDIGCALLPRLLTPGECAEIAALYDEPARFRATISMERYRFGRGEYKYFAEPVPGPVQQLREQLYPRLLPIARDWAAKLRRADKWPDTLAEWLEECHRAGQARPTPILLRRGAWSPAGDLRGAAVAAAQTALHVALEVHRGVLAREVQVAVPPALDAVERRVLAGLEVGVGAADVRIPG